MTTSVILDTLQQYKEHIESQGYFVYAIMLKGSQNYNLDDDESDIDANAILIPTPSQLRSDEKPKFTFPTGEVTCHNIYSFAEIVAKGNPQWIEVCHTEYNIGNSLDLFKHYDLNPSALKGMIMEKFVAFDRLYPSRVKYVEQFGYDPKQLHHIIRLYDVLNLGVKVYKYSDDQRTQMLDIKRGRCPDSKEAAFMMRDSYLAKLNAIYESKKLAYTPQKVDYQALDKIVLDFYKTLP
jgi:hypothetical protein